MSFFDIILIILLFGFIYGGFFRGLIKSLGSILGVIAGVWAGSHFYLLVFLKIGSWFGPFENIGKTVSFAIIFVLATIIIGIIVRIIDKAYDILSFLPFLKTINRFAGALLGLLEGGIVLGLIIFVLAKYSPVDSFLGELLINSTLTRFFLDFIKIIFPFLSVAIKNLSSMI